MAARIVTGLTIIALKNLCISRQAGDHFQMGGNCLNSLLCTKYKTVASQNICPKLFPTLEESTLHYRTRNNENYTLPKCRLDVFKKSFVPDKIHLRNSVSLDIRRETSVNKFKTLLSGLYQTCISKPPSYYSFGKRKLNIIHTKLRHYC